MYVGQITMTRLAPFEQETVSDVITELLSAFRMTGQICGREWSVATTPEGYVATILLPEQSALDAIHNNRWVRKALQKLNGVGLSEPVCSVSVDLISERPCECDSPSSYILYTNFLSYEPPLRCGRCFLPVALYRVPSSEGEVTQGILYWEAYYQACDTLAMGSGPLEQPAMGQVSRLDSDLSQKGIAICRDLSKAVTLPVYYSLHRYGLYSMEQEEMQLCPACHGEWLLSERWHLFDFRCDRCHLVSNIAR
jgi:predicted  nucleic acid-binding Zn ribbon protein